MGRKESVMIFYKILSTLERKLGGKRILDKCTGRMSWPNRGVYFFFEEGENRASPGEGPRVVRIGTHAIDKRRSDTLLWERLRQHRGPFAGSHPGVGDHRGSVFRKHVGFAIINRRQIKCASWGESPLSQREKGLEYDIEREVSGYISKMPFLWVGVDDDPGPNSMRAFIERNSIALLSNLNREPIDPSSKNWLGKYCTNERVMKSGLWNHDYTEKDYDFVLLDILNKFVNMM